MCNNCRPGGTVAKTIWSITAERRVQIAAVPIQEKPIEDFICERCTQVPDWSISKKQSPFSYGRTKTSEEMPVNKEDRHRWHFAFPPSYLCLFLSSFGFLRWLKLKDRNG
ncbi:hypothetical protein BDV28DRAFT_128244 [Aspergillus coremiiformis]|uniref:Uncharacterized protein n=1 Tax=Aspergillus coremiiformis TaxID=138285 RepID=A0A5N6ZDV9_9EURO|nr:hypothetical protein BDV28DRAFT_128244 [Aspergillus coremiiformis]